MNLKMETSFVVVLLFFFLAGVATWTLYFKEYRQHDDINVNDFPKQIGPWVSEEIEIAEEDYAILETHNAFARTYMNPAGEKVQLFIVYSQDNRKVSHPPEICYTGGGATILSNQSVTVDVPDAKVTVPLNKLLLETGRTQQVMYYCFKVGDSFTSNYWKQQLLFSLKNVFGGRSSSALIRFSALVPDDDNWALQTSQMVEGFAREVTPQIMEYIK